MQGKDRKTKNQESSKDNNKQTHKHVKDKSQKIGNDHNRMHGLGTRLKIS